MRNQRICSWGNATRFSSAILALSPSLRVRVLKMYKISLAPWANMAPEQIQARPSRASDQYALGIVTYEWLCGLRPFTGTLEEIAAQHMSIAPPSLRARISLLSPVVEMVVMRALENVSIQALCQRARVCGGLRASLYDRPRSREMLRDSPPKYPL